MKHWLELILLSFAASVLANVPEPRFVRFALTDRAASGSSSAAWNVTAGGGLDGLSRVTQSQNSSVNRPAFGLAAGAGSVWAALDAKPLGIQFDGGDGGQWRADMEVTSGSHTLQVGAVDKTGLYFASATNTFVIASNALDTIQNQYGGNGNVTQRVWVNALGQTNRMQTLSWDAFNRLIAVTDRDALTNGFNWTAAYDGLGRRLSTVYTMVVSNTPVSSPAAASEVDSIYDPQVQFLEVAVSVNDQFSFMTYGPDASGVYGGMQGSGGLEAIGLAGHYNSTCFVQDVFGNVLGSIVAGSPYGVVSWNPTRFSSYGPVPGYQQPALSLDVGLAQSLGWRGKRVDETGYINLGARLYESANALVGFLLPQAADGLDATCQPQPGEHWKGRETLQLQGMFGAFPLERDDYYHPGKNYHPGKKQGHYPADAALGLEVAYTPALARLLCLEGADEMGYEKAQQHLAETGGIDVSARQIQRVMQRVGGAAQAWQERPAQPGGSSVPILYVSVDATGVPMRKEDLAGRAGQQADGSAKNPQGVSGVRVHPAPAR